jgi:hypothetical protein
VAGSRVDGGVVKVFSATWTFTAASTFLLPLRLLPQHRWPPLLFS